MGKVKLLYITVRADHGGGPRHVDLLINNIPSKFEIFVACPPDKPYFQQWQSNQQVQDIFLLPHRKLSLQRLLQLSRFLSAQGITIVHSHGKGAGVYARLLKLLHPKLRVIHTFHGVHTQEYGNLAKTLYYAYEKIASKLTDRFINVSYGERDICLAGGFCSEEKQITIHNGVPDLAECYDQSSQAVYNKFKIVTITRFDYSKHMQLAYAIAKLLQHKADIEFIWVGDGPDKQPLEDQAKADQLNNITFTGFSDKPEEYLRNAQVYLSTSRWEGLPLALIEAASLSIPIIATNVTGNNEVVEHNSNGLLFNGLLPLQAADYILELYNNPNLWDKLSRNARLSYDQKFRVLTMSQKTAAVYLQQV